MHRSAVDTDHLEFGGDRRGAVGRNFQQAVAQIEMPRQDARRDRQRVDDGVEHAETAGPPYQLWARQAPADITLPDNNDAADMAVAQSCARWGAAGGIEVRPSAIRRWGG